MQSFMNSKWLALGQEGLVKTMAMMSLRGRNTGNNFSQSFSCQPAQNIISPQTPTSAECDASEVNPIKIPENAAPNVK
ncbi:hypothetical protein CROQUDRAFT_662873 [Cronartium quercuum f. sp. fusiforme G11]|uniref:Uncharacterized protein n=1 Tax=Cronartium quercuum f. sp. fusiforme G11 TaxID=708437 RepID=A0A9P6NDB9_9BASI|nr:hypothetical protein CROQUDRAFT_662873 [Cronartium quercuum f. sp. fusiforme G11]